MASLLTFFDTTGPADHTVRSHSRASTERAEKYDIDAKLLDDATFAVIDPLMQWDIASTAKDRPLVKWRWPDYQNQTDCVVKGVLPVFQPGAKLIFCAPCPPMLNESFHASGYPYSSATEAYKNTPNLGIVDLGIGGTYSIPLMFPSAYHSRHTSYDRIPPLVHFRLAWADGRVDPIIMTKRIGDPIQFRSLHGGPPGFGDPYRRADIMEKNLYKHRRDQLPLNRLPHEYYFQKVYPSPLIPETLIENAENDDDFYQGKIIPW